MNENKNAHSHSTLKSGNAKVAKLHQFEHSDETGQALWVMGGVTWNTTFLSEDKMVEYINCFLYLKTNWANKYWNLRVLLSVRSIKTAWQRRRLESLNSCCESLWKALEKVAASHVGRRQPSSPEPRKIWISRINAARHWVQSGRCLTCREEQSSDEWKGLRATHAWSWLRMGHSCSSRWVDAEQEKLSGGQNMDWRSKVTDCVSDREGTNPTAVGGILTASIQNQSEFFYWDHRDADHFLPPQ